MISRQQLDQVQTAADTAQATLETARATLIAQIAAVKTAEEQLKAVQGSLVQTR